MTRERLINRLYVASRDTFRAKMANIRDSRVFIAQYQSFVPRGEIRSRDRKVFRPISPKTQYLPRFFKILFVKTNHRRVKARIISDIYRDTARYSENWLFKVGERSKKICLF